MFSDEVLREVAQVAKTHKLDLAALLAVVEIESGGRALEIDGKTPQFLFEKHVFYKQLQHLHPAGLHEAVAQGLAIPAWNPATEYKNEATSSQRLALLVKAKAVHVEAALRSASWGVGQTMGFNAPDLGFVDAVHMVDYMIQGGIPAQVECMVREIERNKLAAKLNAHNWAGFALGYNGVGYRKNAYDTKLASAFARWKPQETRIAALPPPVHTDPVPAPTATVPPPKPVVAATPPPQPSLWASVVSLFTKKTPAA